MSARLHECGSMGSGRLTTLWSTKIYTSMLHARVIFCIQAQSGSVCWPAIVVATGTASNVPLNGAYKMPIAIMLHSREGDL